METELSTRASGRSSDHSCGTTLLQRIPRRISKVVEDLFYRIGLRIARKPYKCLGASALCVLLSLFGFYSFHQEKDPLKLWVPPDSDFVRDTRYLLNNLQSGLQMETLLLTANNVLEPKVLLQLHAITKRVVAAQSRSQSRSNETVAWTDVCFRVPSILTVAAGRSRRQAAGSLQDDFFDAEPGAAMNESVFEPAVYLDSKLYCAIVEHLPSACLLYSILDLWAFDESKISQQTKQDVILQLDRTTTSPTLGHQMDFAGLLGGIERDETGRIVSAKAVKTQWAVRINFTEISTQDFGNQAGTAEWATVDVLKWEAAFLNTLGYSADALDALDALHANASDSLRIRYEAGRSFGDLTESNIFQDIDKLMIGILLMFLYVLSIISSANWIELRVWLTVGGLLCVAGAFLIAVGLCSLLRIPYGPVHTSLPFMLLGLGIDDLFIMAASWDQVEQDERHKRKSLPERVALMLREAGSAICITSLTDVVAFLIGASTILPSLQSFCIYAAVGVLANFLLQITCFVALFTLDRKRIEAKRNAIIPCIVHPYAPQLQPQQRRWWRIVLPKLSTPLQEHHSKIILATPGKWIVFSITVLVGLFGIAGSLRIEEWFDPNWFVPENSYLSEYNEARSLYYSDNGYEAFVLMGGPIEYHREFPKIIALTEDLGNLSSILHVQAWPIDFAEFLATYFEIDLRESTLDRDTFHQHLARFLFSRTGGKYQNNIQFIDKLHCGRMAPEIRLATIAFQFKAFHGPYEWIPAMDQSKQLAKDAKITGFVTIWSKMFGSWLTDKLIAGEVLRNLLLALVAVMAITGSLIAQFQTCIWILSSVLLTILDVCGCMYFWGLTINIVSCIALELAVGLSIDYSAHVAHAYLMSSATTEGDRLDRKSRTEHALRHTGAAVAYGAGSTLLALSMMVFSDAYVFRSFFKIFFLVIVLGIWHGLFFLPVVLSTVGPPSIRSNPNPNPNHYRKRERASVNLTVIHGDPPPPPPPQSPLLISHSIAESNNLLDSRARQQQQQQQGQQAEREQLHDAS